MSCKHSIKNLQRLTPNFCFPETNHVSTIKTPRNCVLGLLRDDNKAGLSCNLSELILNQCKLVDRGSLVGEGEADEDAK